MQWSGCGFKETKKKNTGSTKGKEGQNDLTLKNIMSVSFFKEDHIDQ